MHKVEIPSWAVERALARRGQLHPFDDLDPAHTALVVVDLQNGFMAPGQPAEVAQARDRAERQPPRQCDARGGWYGGVDPEHDHSGERKLLVGVVRPFRPRGM